MPRDAGLGNSQSFTIPPKQSRNRANPFQPGFDVTNPLEQEVARRRTFAIISHPDAGKTTLTEKFLLYGGALQLAGSVRASKNQRSVTSDWMELEKKRLEDYDAESKISHQFSLPGRSLYPSPDPCHG